MKKNLRKTKFNRVLAGIMMVVMILTGINFSPFMSLKAATEYITLYFVDNTDKQWVKNDNAKMKAIDNTNGHDSYWMTQVNDTLWSVSVPKSAYNITFNRYNSDKSTQWNSWSAGGRDKNNAYYADGDEYGHWGDYEEEELYFHEGDVIYLDVSEFPEWENNDAIMYVNFTNASKKENGGNDVVISNADKTRYNPQKVEKQKEKHVYQYVVTQKEEGTSELRFWRGSSETLWNCSVVLSYKEYLKGMNCVKISGWNNEGNLSTRKTTVDLDADTDQDGTADYIEDYFKTDKTREDTDGDGLSDYVEIYSFTLDPTIADTDGNGVPDGEEDIDSDGLTNIKEVQVKTNIVETDTDKDGLTDYEEVVTYKTNPLKEDTDGDGASDAKEIEFGTDPLIVEKSFQVSATAEENDTVKVSVETELSGKQVNTLSVKKYENEVLFPTDMPGYIGGAYDFSVDGSIDSATIKFEFDSSLLSDKSFDPVIYYFNEKTQQLEELETTVKGNTATTKVTHFSKYILLNRKVFQIAFSWMDVWSTGGYSDVEVVFVIDDSGSMASNDADNQRLSVAKNAIDNLPDNSKIGVVSFFGATKFLTPQLTNDKGQAKSYLTDRYFISYGITNMYDAICGAFSLYRKVRFWG